MISKPKEAITKIEAFLNRHPYILISGTLLLIVLLAISRRPDLFRHPQFWAEDGAVWYTDAYQNGFWDTILKPYPEFLQIPARLFAYLSTLLPFKFAPLLLNVTGLCMQLLPLVLLLGGRLKRAVPSRLIAIGLCVIYIALPNTTEVFSSFANIQWHLGLAALLVIIADTNRRRIWQVFDWSVLIACGLSGPMVIFLLPIAVIRWWRSKEAAPRRALYIVCALAAIQIFTALFISAYHRTGSPPAADILTFAKIVGGQIFTGGILGQAYFDIFYKDEIRLYLTLIVGLGFMAYALVKGPWWLKMLTIYSPILVAATLFTLKNPPDSSYDIWQGLTNPTGGQRYWYLPILIWVMTLIWLAFRAHNKIIQSVSTTMVLLLIIIGIPVGWRIEPLHNYNFGTYAKQFETAPAGQPFTIPLNPAGWQMTLYKK